MYEQIIWQYSRGELAFSSFTQKLDLADRFRPLMLTATLPYRIFPATNTLLIFQATVIGLTAIPIYLLALAKTHHHFFSLIITGGFLSFVGVQSLLMNDFHEVALLPLTLAWVFYFMETRRWSGYWFAIAASLMVREYVGFLLCAVSAYALFTGKPKRIALFTASISFIYSLTVIFVLMPHLGQAGYKGFLGGDQSFAQELIYLFSHPLYTIQYFFLPTTKLKTLLLSFSSFAFLPLLSPWLLLPIGVQFAQRFLDLSHPYRWTLFFQYSADLAVFLAVATILGIAQLKERLKLQPKSILRLYGLKTGVCSGLILSGTFLLRKKVWRLSPPNVSIYTKVGLLLVIIILAHQILLPVPLKLLTKRDFFSTKPFMQDNREVIALIPPAASVATQNNLAPHLAQRYELFILPQISQADYILVDLHPDQDRYNFFGLTLPEMQQLLKNSQGNYQLIKRVGDTYLLQRKNASVSPFLPTTAMSR